MQLKTLTTLLLTTSVPLLAAARPLSSSPTPRTPTPPLWRTSQALKSDLSKLDSAVQKWDGQLMSAMPMKDDATNAQDDVEKALKDVKAIDSLTPETKEKLTSAIRELKPEAEGALQHLVQKAPQFQKSGLTQPIGDNLQDLKGSLGQVEQTFKSKTSGQEVQELDQASKETSSELDKAIKVFS